MSEGNITIFQEDGELIRQIISGNNKDYITIINDENGTTTVNVTIIGSTFSQFDKRYYVLIDNDFVKSRIYKEPLYGLNERVWSFTISKCIVTF